MEGLPIKLPKTKPPIREKRICSYELYDGIERRNEDALYGNGFIGVDKRFRKDRRVKGRRKKSL